MKKLSIARCVRDIMNLVEWHVDGDTERYDEYMYAIAHLLDERYREQLRQLVHNGPVWAGNVTDSHAKDDLITMHLAVKTAVNGSTGYTAAKPQAILILNHVDDAEQYSM